MKTKCKNLIYLGVNYGDTFRQYVNTGNYNHCYGFEANPNLSKKLIEEFKHNSKVTIITGAVGDSAERVPFYVYQTNCGAVASSLGKITKDFHKKHGDNIKLIETISVPGIVLKDFLMQNNIDYIDTYISDIQGMDYFVLSTLKEDFLDKRKIRKIGVETECEYTPSRSYDLKYSNKSAKFLTLLEENYNLIGKQIGNYNESDPNHWWHRDLYFELK